VRVVDEDSREIALSVLKKAFGNNPGVISIIKKPKNNSDKDERIEALCSFCLNVSIDKQGAFISSDNKGVALIFESNKKLGLRSFFINYFNFGQRCVGWLGAIGAVKRERQIRKRRPAQKHLYFWMLAVEDRTYGLDTIKEIRDFVFKISREKELDIYAETTVKGMLSLYLRYGFEIYDEWTAKDGVKRYFIKRSFKS